MGFNSTDANEKQATPELNTKSPGVKPVKSADFNDFLESYSHSEADSYDILSRVSDFFTRIRNEKSPDEISIKEATDVFVNAGAKLEINENRIKISVNIHNFIPKFSGAPERQIGVQDLLPQMKSFHYILSMPSEKGEEVIERDVKGVIGENNEIKYLYVEDGEERELEKIYGLAGNLILDINMKDVWSPEEIIKDKTNKSLELEYQNIFSMLSDENAEE